MDGSVSTTTGSDVLYEQPWRERNITWRNKSTQVLVDSSQELLTSVKQTAILFCQRREGRATCIFVVGLLLSFIGLSLLGLVLEICGFILLFRGITTVIIQLLRKVSALRPLLDSPVIKQIIHSYGETVTRDSLKQEIEDYVPLKDLLDGEAQFPRVNILLMGPVGVGKSSFFNTINSIFRGKIFNIARSGSSEHSLTTKFRRYPIISNSSNKKMNFCLCDAMGLEQNHLMEKVNMRYLLDGHIEDQFLLDPSNPVSPNIPGFKKRPSLEDQIHCVVIAVDASIVDAADAIKDTIQNIKEMQLIMNTLDIPQVVVLTCIDKICKQTKFDASNALKSKTVDRTVGKVSEMFGLPQHNIFPVKNYEKECELDPNIDILALLALKGILNNADAFLFSHREEILQHYAA